MSWHTALLAAPIVGLAAHPIAAASIEAETEALFGIGLLSGSVVEGLPDGVTIASAEATDDDGIEEEGDASAESFSVGFADPEDGADLLGGEVFTGATAFDGGSASATAEATGTLSLSNAGDTDAVVEFGLDAMISVGLDSEPLAFGEAQTSIDLLIDGVSVFFEEVSVDAPRWPTVEPPPIGPLEGLVFGVLAPAGGSADVAVALTTSASAEGPAPIPLPAGLPLLAAGLGALAIASRARRSGRV